MKRIITLMCLLAITNISIGQVTFTSTFQNWGGGVPTDWFGSSSTIPNASVLQQFTGSTYGTYLCGLSNSGSVGTGLATQSVTVVAGAKYKLEIDLESNMGDMAIGYYDVTNSTYGPISAYRSVVTSSSGMLVVDSLTFPATCVSAQFIVYAKNTAAFGIGNIGVSLDRVIISFMSGPIVPPPPPTGPVYDTLSIYEIQYTTAANGNSPYEDSLVQTSGIVTATHISGYWIQDSASAWNGIYVYDNLNTPALGDDVTVRAEVDEFFSLTELKNVDTLITNSIGNALPTQISINTTELSNEEKYEGVLCKVSAGHCVNAAAGNGEWDFTNTSDTGVVDDLIYAFVPTLNMKYDVTGVIQFTFGEYKIEPRDSADLVLINTTTINENNLEFSIYPNPSNNSITVEGINTAFAEVFSMDGKLVFSRNLVYTHTIDVSSLNDGVYLLKLTSLKKNGTIRFVKQ